MTQNCYKINRYWDLFYHENSEVRENKGQMINITVQHEKYYINMAGNV